METSHYLESRRPYYLDFFFTIDRLAGSETILGRKGKLTVMQF